MQQEGEPGGSLGVPPLSGNGAGVGGGLLVLPGSPGSPGSGRGVEEEEDLPSGVAA